MKQLVSRVAPLVLGAAYLSACAVDRPNELWLFHLSKSLKTIH